MKSEHGAGYVPSFGMRVLPICIIAVLLIGMFLLEYYLAKRSGKLPGLIIPLCFAIVSVVIVITNLTWSSAPWQTGIDVIIFFLISNIPTALNLLIYCVVRNRQKRRRSMDKMRIHDLE